MRIKLSKLNSIDHKSHFSMLSTIKHKWSSTWSDAKKGLQFRKRRGQVDAMPSTTKNRLKIDEGQRHNNKSKRHNRTSVHFACLPFSALIWHFNASSGRFVVPFTTVHRLLPLYSLQASLWLASLRSARSCSKLNDNLLHCARFSLNFRRPRATLPSFTWLLLTLITRHSWTFFVIAVILQITCEYQIIGLVSQISHLCVMVTLSGRHKRIIGQIRRVILATQAIHFGIGGLLLGKVSSPSEEMATVVNEGFSVAQ